jgi:hypothetical protein
MQNEKLMCDAIDGKKMTLEKRSGIESAHTGDLVLPTGAVVRQV